MCHFNRLYFVTINEFCCYLKHTSSRLLYFVQQTGIVRFFLLFTQYCVKILITSIWDTQYIWVLNSCMHCEKSKLKRFVLLLFFSLLSISSLLILLKLLFTALFSSCILNLKRLRNGLSTYSLFQIGFGLSYYLTLFGLL